MSKYSKAPDSMVSVVDATGKAHKVTQRAYDIVYKKQGFKLANDPVEDTPVHVEDDFFLLTCEELKNIKNDDLKAFLDKEEIEYEPKAIKDDLIDLILGE